MFAMMKDEHKDNIPVERCDSGLGQFYWGPTMDAIILVKNTNVLQPLVNKSCHRLLGLLLYWELAQVRWESTVFEYFLYDVS